MLWLILFRWMHILGAIMLVGGALFYWRAIWPGIAALDANARKDRFASIRPHWSKLVMVSIMLLLVSGLANIVLMAKAGEFKQVASWYHILLLIKILLALSVFFLMSLITGRSARAERLRENSSFWLTLASMLAVLVVLLAGVMKVTPRKSSLPGPAVELPVVPVLDQEPSAVSE